MSHRNARSVRPVLEEFESRLLLSGEGLDAFVDVAQDLDHDNTQASLLVLDSQSSTHHRVEHSSLELAFIDTRVPEYQLLLDDLARRQPDGGRSIEAVILDPGRDGIEQISEALSSHGSVDAVHIISHASEGEVQIAGTTLSGDSLPSHAKALSSWAPHLAPNADILLYGCELAAGETGTQLIDQLGHLTGADVAASDNLTGAAGKDGDWDLEYTTGAVETELVPGAQVQHLWQGILAANQPPVHVVPGTQTLAYGDTLVFSAANGNRISVTDPDAGTSELQVTMRVNNGTLSLSQTTGLTLSSGSGSNDTSMVFTGTLVDINAALEGMSYDFDTGFIGSDNLVIITEDLVNSGESPLDQDPAIEVKYTFDIDGTSATGTNHATLFGNPAVVTDPERGNVMSFDGVDDYAAVPGGVTNGESRFTFSFWLKTTENGSDPTYHLRPTLMGIDTDGFGTRDLSITTNDGYIGLWTGLGGGGTTREYLSTTTQINDNQWHQITVSTNPGMARLYVDGNFEAQLKSGMTLDALDFFIGAENHEGSPGQYHQGLFDDVRIFDRALTSSEVSSLYGGLFDADAVTIQHHPVAADDSGTGFDTSEDTAFITADVLANDHTGMLPTTINAFDAVSAQGGSVSYNNDGTFSYTPAANFNGSDSFTYSITDSDGESSVATVTIAVGAVNDTPVASNDSGAGFGTSEDTTFTTADVLSNDNLGDEPTTITAYDAVSAQGGSVGYNNDGTFSYTPAANFNGSDSFTYTIRDLDGETSVATVTVAVSPVNDAPVASNDSGTAFNTSEDTAFTTGNVLSNDNLGDEPTTITAYDAVSAQGGSVGYNNDGTFSYTPAANFNGSDSFTYTIRDQDGETAVATVTLAVSAVNDTPVASSESYQVYSGGVLATTQGIDDLLINDSDVDGNTLSIVPTAVTEPSNGSLTLNADGTFTYTPDPGFTGVDSFTYQVTDGNGGTAEVTATIAVNSLPATNPEPETPVNEFQSPSGTPVAEEPGTTEPGPDEPDDATAYNGTQYNYGHLGGGSVTAKPFISPDTAPGGGPGTLLNSSAHAYEPQNNLHYDMPEIEQLGGGLAGIDVFPTLPGGITAVVAEFDADHRLWAQIETMKSDMDNTEDTVLSLSLVSSPAGALTAFSLSAGYFSWLFRGSALFASMISAVPAWSTFDPLPVVAAKRKKREKTEARADAGPLGLTLPNGEHTARFHNNSDASKGEKP